MDMTYELDDSVHAPTTRVSKKGSFGMAFCTNSVWPIDIGSGKTFASNWKAQDATDQY